MLIPERSAARVLDLEACDPERLIRDALAGESAGTASPWSARELYFTWLLNLPLEIDAAHAAALLLQYLRPPAATDRPAQDLLDLLRTTTAYPRERLEPAAVDRTRLH